MRKAENSEDIVIRRVKRKELNQVFKLISDAFQKENEITGLDVRRLQRMGRFYSLISGFLFLFDIFHIDFEAILVAVSGNMVVGEFHLVPLGKKMWRVDSAAVDKQFRGRGIYRKLSKNAYKYIVRRSGERMIASHWTNNVAAEKITRERGYRVFSVNTLMHLEIGEIPLEVVRDDILIRTAKNTNIEKIYEISKVLDPKRIEAYKVTAKDFQGSFWSRFRNKIANVHSEKWVLEVGDEIVGYTNVTYTSPEEAANIESFYVLPSEDSPRLAGVLLRHILGFLLRRNIKGVTVRLNREWLEIIEVFRRFGFRHVTFTCEKVKELDYDIYIS